MNRADMSWALQAVLPHAKTEVGIDGPYLFATDRYTTGISKAEHALGPTVALPAKEALDLERFVRPKRVADRIERVQCAVNGAELHIACGDDSAVFETIPPVVTLAILRDLLASLYVLPPDRREQVFHPQWAARFAKAQRGEDDALRVYPRMTHRPMDRGIAIVTVGDAFIGAIAGRTHDDWASPMLSLLQNAEKGEAA